ncbi:hypothetical protein ANCDUO_03993 [Ancylostoma duodenale]|uniref:Uncharacterized protein n=1 Tax=Ancylostoma duodenale TaxID=51022 RepID=A0A0C2DSD2_9BILA|nr:hypothetical protein ANCDUO_03993 [Ancylostoma duodenale]
MTHCTEEFDFVIPLPNVPTAGLCLVVEWMQRKSQVCGKISSFSCQCSRKSEDLLYSGEDPKLANWERAFFHRLDKDDLFLLLNTANYMGIISLIASGARFVAEVISVSISILS